MTEYAHEYFTRRNEYEIMCSTYVQNDDDDDGNNNNNSNRNNNVPQGGHISPTIFSFINNIKSVICNSNFLMFVDDLKLLLITSCENDCRFKQSDLDALSALGLLT